MQRSNKRVTTSVIVMLAITVMNLAATLYSQGQKKTRPDDVRNMAQISERVEKSKGRFPVADYEALEPIGPEARAKRKARSERHNKSMWGVKGGLNAPPDSGNEFVLTNDWEVNTPRLPAVQSDVVVMGDILDANSYVSTDKNGVYSEFTLCIEGILKSDNASPLSPGGLVSVERQGGRVRYPSGRVEWFRIALQEMPEINHRYVLFLKRVDEGSFSIITGYDLRGGRVYALDSGASQFRVFDEMDEASFLQQVREAITKQ